jgi:glycosyltransferase involved in cell wall biosynthesis
MRIAHVYKDAYPPLVAGITRYMAMVANAAVQRGHEVELYVAGVRTSRRDVLADGVVVNRFAEVGRALSNPLSPALLRATRKIEADVLHLHMPNPVGELGALGFRGPIVTSFHAQLGRQRLLGTAYRPLQQTLLRRSASVLVGSPRMLGAEELEAHRDRAAVLPYGVDAALVSDVDRTLAPGARLRLLFVGRLVYYKGLDVLLDGVSALDGVTLTVIGEGPLGEQVARRVATEPGLRGRVELRGGVSDAALAEAYRTHDVFVAPSISRAEAFGISMAEALANGLPAISTRLGTGTDWVNEHDVTGLVVEPNDAAALRAAFRDLGDVERWTRLSRGARDVAGRRYSPEGHVQALLEHYAAAAS